jgi:hypothetical protein
MDEPTGTPDDRFELVTFDLDDHMIPEHHPDVKAAYARGFHLVSVVRLERRDKSRLFLQRRIR